MATNPLRKPADNPSTVLSSLGTGVGELLKKLSERSRDVFWIRSPDYKKQIYISPSYEEVWGRSCEELYRNPESWANSLHPEDRQQMLKSTKERTPDIEPDATFLFEYRCIRPDGETRWIRDESFPIYNDLGIHVGFAGIALDITKEKELLRAKELAKIANQSKSDFLANMSHDLRTPLNWLLGAADILNKRNQDPDKTKLLEMIVDGGKRILHMVEEILDYSKLESGKHPLHREPFNIRQTIEEVITMFIQDATSKQVDLILDYPDDVCRHVLGDPQRIRRIITNLLGNAIKFTNKGHILIKVQSIESSHEQVHLEIIIEDTGIGIPEEKLNSIFERFEKVEPSYQSRYKGVGLGLAIVKKFIDAMQGEIMVSSTLEIGSQFKCHLPFNRIRQRSKYSFWLNHLQEVRILIVDDLPIRALAYQNNLGKNASTTTGENAFQTIIKAIENNLPYDIILIDDQVLNPTFGDLAEQILGLNHSPLLLSCVSNTRDADIFEAKDHGFYDIFPKPLLPGELSLLISTVWLQWRAQTLNKVILIKQLKPKILLIEDEPFGQRIVSMLLEEELGCSVTVAENASRGLSSFEENDFDLVLMDIGLPDEDGLKLTEKFRRIEDSFETTPIVALTAHASDEIIMECRRVGMDGHLAKPASTEALLSVIWSHILQLGTLD